MSTQPALPARPAQAAQPAQPAQAAQPAGGMAPPGAVPGDGDFSLSLDRIRLIGRLGMKLIRLCPLYVAGYVLLSLIGQTAIPLLMPIFLGQLTNSVQSAGLPASAPRESGAPGADAGSSSAPASSPAQQGSSAVPPYMFWLFLTLLAFPLSIGFRLSQAKMDGMMERQVRQNLYEKVIRQAPEFFHRYNPGELANMLTQSTTEAQQALRSLTVDPVLQFVSLAIALALIAQQLRQINPSYLWPAVGLMVISGVGSFWLVQWKGDKAVGELQRQSQEERFALAGLADSAVKSPEEIQAMDAEEFFCKRHDAALLRLTGLKVRQSFTLELLNSAIGMPTQIVLACLYGLVVYQATRTLGGASHVSPGIFITIAGLTPQLMQPFKSFAMLGVMAAASWPAVQIVTKLMAEENRIKDLPGARDIQDVKPTLEARHVHFAYAPGLPKVFDDLTFSVPSPGNTGLVARMGQGKTTFFRLALRFYDPSSGEILLGGHPTTSFTLHSLRRYVVIMSQFPAFFHDTVGENFRLGRPDATDSEIQALCEKTGLWKKLEEAIGKDPLNRQFAAGMNLSGGYKKLFALTRCLLRNPTFLFLDEPTTNMSNDEKYVLIPLMREACKGKTVIVVDHDLSWLTQFCDYFVVLDRGTIAQQGTAPELLARPGVLKELYDLAHAPGQTSAP